MIKIYKNNLDVEKILSEIYSKYKSQNFGAILNFIGVVRDEISQGAKIDGLSFDIYEPLLEKWFFSWEKIAQEKNAKILMFHSVGDVKIHESSFVAVVLSLQRKDGLFLLNNFVEDFKASAPIWKYDLIEGKRIFAKNRSKMLKNSGILK